MYIECQRNINKCIMNLKNGKSVIYPTESVFGIGCDPDNEKAIINLLKIKNRNAKKGLIIISYNYKHIKKYISTKNVPKNNIKKFYKFWPGNFTLLHPANNNVSFYIKGNSELVAVRITKNKFVKSLCKNFGKAIISTSANLSGLNPCRNMKEVLYQFGKKICIMNGYVNLKKSPSTIINIINGEYIRNG
ncbi:L-threonylcarbamoyladenylate synthase [Buchnera aphidicola (Ceratovacuna keduensis)]|uniref:L-threonylcarbamoyladenylate synthase n=1 Tax=Buchnera aphidicola TaxID=9 RepID=UPI0031B89A23